MDEKRVKPSVGQWITQIVAAVLGTIGTYVFLTAYGQWMKYPSLADITGANQKMVLGVGLLLVCVIITLFVWFGQPNKK